MPIITVTMKSEELVVVTFVRIGETCKEYLAIFRFSDPELREFVYLRNILSVV